MRRLFAVLCCLVLVSTVVPLGLLGSTPVARAAPSEAPDNPRLFTETGFSVSDDAFWDFFNKRGGLRTFGYPVSRKFSLLGYDVQFFQRRIMQKQANGSVTLLNLLDPDVMPFTSINFATLPASNPVLTGQIPAPGSSDYFQKVLAFVQATSPNAWQTLNVNFYRTFMDTVKYEEAYPKRDGDPNWMTGINLEMWGVPTSNPTADPNNNDFAYQRFQRGVLHFDKKTGLTQGLLLADYLKSIITGLNLPADLDVAARTSRYYKQYNNAAANGLNRPNDLPNSDMKDAFEPDGGTVTTPIVAPPTPGPTPTPTPTPGPSTPPSATSGLRYGMQAHLFDQDQNRVYDSLKGAGFDWMKQQVRWDTIEGSKGSFNWGGLDSIVNNAQLKGVKLLFSVVAAPKWATGNNPVDGPPNNYDDLADFFRQLANRYRGKVHAYEVWNEQNLWYEWGGKGKLNAANYVDMLRRSYQAIKATDPNAIVVSGALTPTGVNNGVDAIDDVVYLDQMYQAGLKDYTDAIGAHMAGYNNAPDDWADRNTVNTPGYKGHGSFYFRRIDQLNEVMVRNGDNKQLWITEYEWGAIDRLPDDLRSYDWTTHLSEQQVASFYVQGIQSIRTQRSWVGAVFVWNLNWRTFSDKYKREQAIFGILNEDWSPRSIYIGLRDMPK